MYMRQLYGLNSGFKKHCSSLGFKLEQLATGAKPIYTFTVIEPFDFTTSQILDWELEMIQNALDKQEIEITQHAADAAEDDNLTLIQLLEAVLVGVPVNKDLPDNELQRLPGINFEHRTSDQRWYRIKVAWVEKYLIITAHTI